MHNVRSPEEAVHCAFPFGCCAMCMCVFMEAVLMRFSLENSNAGGVLMEAVLSACPYKRLYYMCVVQKKKFMNVQLRRGSWA